MKTAALAVWRKVYGGLPVSQASGPPSGGVAFLGNSPQFASQWPGARLYVEWAPTAPLATYGDDSRAWPWEDITSDVRYNNGVSISPMGRADATAQTQPAGCSFTLDNRTGKYSRGPQNTAYYPNVRLNVPVRVSVSLDGTPAGKVVRFQGYAWSFKPGWDSTGADAVVNLSASGFIRRLEQRSTPLRSAIFRYVRQFSFAFNAYWPMEDVSGSTQLVSGINGKAPLNMSNMTLASYNGVPGSDSIPTLTATSTYSGGITGSFAQSDSGSTVVFYMNLPAVTAGDTAIMRIHMQGYGSTSVSRWELVILSGNASTIHVNGYDSSGTIIKSVDFSGLTFAGAGPIQVVFGMHQNGAATEIGLTMGGILFSGSAFASTTLAATTVGTPYQVSMLANAQNANISIGHIQVLNQYVNSLNPLPSQGWVADNGDSAVSRILRLSSEENFPISFDGADVSSGFSRTPFATGDYTWIGYQGQDPYLTLVRAAASSDLGVLGDGLGPGIYYRDRSNILNLTSKMTLNATADEIMPPFQPEDDDQKIVNSATVTRSGGSSASTSDTTGPLGTNAIAVYDNSVTASLRYDAQCLDIAGWLVHLGTVEGYRYPTLSLNMSKIPNHAVEWLSIKPGDMFTVSNISSFAPQHPSGSIALIAQGWTETLTNQKWEVALNCSPADCWRVVELSDVSTSAAADTQFTRRLDSDGSTLNSTAAAGATSLSVATASNSPLWTTSAVDVPMDLNVGGWHVTCSAISGGSSPQTFAISALPGAVIAGQTVKLWYPPTLGI